MSKAEYNRRWRIDNPNKVKEKQLKWKYGIGLAEFNRMYEKQDGVCAICNKECKRGISLCVDHCHGTKKVRGLLCNACNCTLGHIEKVFRDKERFNKFNEYLGGLLS